MSVQNEYADGINAIHAEYKPGKDLAVQKSDAITALETETATITNVINNDPKLNKVAKDDQIAQINSILEISKNKINRLTTSQEVSDEENASISLSLIHI